MSYERESIKTRTATRSCRTRKRAGSVVWPAPGAAVADTVL